MVMAVDFHGDGVRWQICSFLVTTIEDLMLRIDFLVVFASGDSTGS
jgi:hypothetical protein